MNFLKLNFQGTIHQPSSEIFEKFDKLCLLAEGKLAFFGERNQAIEFFKK